MYFQILHACVAAASRGHANYMRVTRMLHACDTREPFKLWVICTVQRDHLVHKGCDICCLLERHMNLWHDDYDVLIQELFIVITLFVIPIDILYLEILKNI